MLKTYEYTHSNNRRAETLEQSAKMFFKANPQLKGEWESKIYAMAANGGGYETDAVPASGYAGRDGMEKTALEVTAGDVEFLSPRSDDQQQQEPAPERGGFTEVTGDDADLPF